MAFPAAWFYTFYFNPEFRLLIPVIQRKESWAHRMRQESPHLTFVSGGSSSSFQVNTALLHEEFGLHVVNTGMTAGMGLDGTVAFSSTFLKPGDRLLLMTEPGLLAGGGGELTASACQVMVVTPRQTPPFFQKSLPPHSLLHLLLQSRPGVEHATIMAGKLLTKHELYRYKLEDYGPDGFATTPIRTPLEGKGMEIEAYTLTPKGRNFLKELKAWADEKQIEVVYLMPVRYIHASRLAAQREANLRFMRQVAEIIPVWIDSYAGAGDRPEDFADTLLHMSREGAAERTREIGRKFTSQLEKTGAYAGAFLNPNRSRDR